MKKLKILYLGNFDNPLSDSTERHIKYALEELGHTVLAIDESEFKDYDRDENVENRVDIKILENNDADMFLFHKGGVSQYIGLDLLVKLLTYITCPKVCWYLDKVFPDREEYIEYVASYCDYVFLTDETFVKRHSFKNMFPLRQGIGNEDTSLGKVREEYKCDIAFTGNIYEGREGFDRAIQSKYGKKYKKFNNVFNRDLYDLCRSAKIVVAPRHPSDEFYWSSRFYLTLGSGGFLIHPDLYGLKEEGWLEGRHFAGYKTNQELFDTIDYYLEHEDERKKIQDAGYKHCISEFTYKHRVEEMLNKINGEGIKSNL